MRRAAISVALAVSCLGLLAAPAQATFHLNMVNEVMLASASGNTGEQFVELLDLGGTEEQFTPVFAPYKLIVYDVRNDAVAPLVALGAQLGSSPADVADRVEKTEYGRFGWGARLRGEPVRAVAAAGRRLSTRDALRA